MPRFPKATLSDIEKCERAEHKVIVALATAQYPKLCGGRWDSIGCPKSWIQGEWAFEAFITDIGKLKRLPDRFHKWERINPNHSYCGVNLKVVLKPEWKKEVIAAIREELAKSKDLKVVLAALNKMGCPSENNKGFTELGLAEFIKLNKI